MGRRTPNQPSSHDLHVDYIYSLFVSDNFALVIGLGVGIPLFFVAVLIVAIVIIYASKMKKRRHRYRTEDYDRLVAFEGCFCSL